MGEAQNTASGRNGRDLSSFEITADDVEKMGTGDRENSELEGPRFNGICPERQIIEHGESDDPNYKGKPLSTVE